MTSPSGITASTAASSQQSVQDVLGSDRWVAANYVSDRLPNHPDPEAFMHRLQLAYNSLAEELKDDDGLADLDAANTLFARQIKRHWKPHLFHNMGCSDNFSHLWAVKKGWNPSL